MSVVAFFKPGSKARVLAGDTPHWIANHKTRSDYILACVLSCPPWVDRWELEALRAFAKAMTKMHGKQYVLDHIVPVTHPRVCGLTVPWNLRVITWVSNAHKGNKFDPDQLELFPDTAPDMMMGLGDSDFKWYNELRDQVVLFDYA